MSDKAIEPQRAYSINEVAELLNMHPASLRRKLTNPKDVFIQRASPRKIGKEWRFMGENLLTALGSLSYKPKIVVEKKGNIPF